MSVTLTDSELPWPSLKGADGEECQHCFSHIVEMEGMLLPDPLLDVWPCDITILVHDELPPAREEWCLRLAIV